MKYKAVIKLKKPKAVIRLKKKIKPEVKVKKIKSIIKIPKEIITKLKVIEEIDGSYFSGDLIKTLKGEYFS